MNRTVTFASAAMMASVVLSGCATQPAQVDIAPLNARAELAAARADAQPTANISNPVATPDALTEDLLSLTAAPVSSNNRIDVEAKSRPVDAFFNDLGEAMGINILVDPAVTGVVNLSLRNVTMTQVIAALRDLYGFEFSKTPYGYRVGPNQLTTKVYKLNYLNLERSGSSKTSVGGDDSNTVTTAFSASGASGNGFWSGIQASILGLISNDAQVAQPVIINSQTGLVVVHATTKEHAAIARFLADAELIMQKQVIIEAKIVEVTLDHEYRSGINWNFFNNNFGSSETSAGVGLQADTVPGVPDIGGLFSLNVGLDNFTSMLQLLDHQGDVQVLSSPRVSTLNNQKAVIKVGADEYFATVTSVSGGGDDNSGNDQAVELVKFFSGIALDVTPQIGDDNGVTLHVRPTVTDVREQTKVINLGSESFSLPLAYSNIRESDSIIRATSGQIVVIGGLLQQKQDATNTGLPWLNKVPVLRRLFAQDRQSQQKSELVILLKPTVFDDSTMLDDIDSVLNRLD